jgi:hypothetical protein
MSKGWSEEGKERFGTTESRAETPLESELKGYSFPKKSQPTVIKTA